MGADKLAENTPNATKIVAPNCLPKPKSLDFDEKRLHWASVVRISYESTIMKKTRKIQLQVFSGFLVCLLLCFDISAVYIVNIRDNLCTKQGNSSIFDRQRQQGLTEALEYKVGPNASS